MKSLYAVFATVCVGLVLASCSGTPEATKAGDPQDLEPVTCIAVVPSQMGSDEEVAKLGGYYENIRTGLLYVDSVLAQELKGNPKVRLVSSQQLERDVMGNLGTTIDEAGRATSCDVVMVTTLKKFKQRQGTTYAADEPASTSFEIRLYNTNEKNVIWAADFSETQQSLLSNIFSFGKAQSRGFQWITVEELVKEGLKERIAECPYLK